MNRILVLGMVASLAAYLFIAQSLRRIEFAARSRNAAGSIFLTKAGKRRFICSGTLFAHTENGDGLFLTARHCVYEDANPEEGAEAGLLGNEEVSFSDNEAGPFYTAIPSTLSATDVLSFIEIVNGRGLPTVRLGDENLTPPGSTLTNYTYGLDFGKMGVELKSVAPIFNHFPNDILSSYLVWSHSMPVIGLAIPGSSGSGLFDPKQQSIVGIIVGGGPRLGTLVIAIPVSRAWKLLSDPTSQDILPKVAPTQPTIPADVFASQFGKTHTFKIASQPGDLQFTHGGYVFKVNTMGVGLSSKFYFDVPVYIDAAVPGQYRLHTTAKEGYSVDAILVSKAG